MANLRKELEDYEARYGEPIEAMVVGRHDNAEYGAPVGIDENVILTREAGLAKVDQEYSNGYGGADCFPFYAWTKSRVFFVHEYDGATGIRWAPRNPMAVEPEFSGNSPAMDWIKDKVAEKTT